MLVHPDEKNLVASVRKGDMNAYNTLVSRYQRRLYSVIYRMTRNHHITDDLLQETFVKLYTSIDKFDDRYPVYPWLYRIAINQTINCLKKENKHFKDSSIEEDEEEKHKQYGDNTDFYSPEVTFIQKERDTKILEALQQISPTYRAALVLRVFEDLSYKEIADVLQCNVGTVMSRLNRARLQLKEILEDYMKSEISKEGASGK